MAENPMTEEEVKRLRRMLKPFSKFNSFIYKLTGGRIMGRLRGRPIMLVTMTGAKSGKGGAPRSPVWTNNLIANPDVVVQYKSKKMNLRARRVEDAEKAEVWPVCVEHYHEYDDYQKRTDRKIPVFVCEPR